MTRKFLNYVVVALLLAVGMHASHLRAQSTSGGGDALKKAHVLERLVEATAPPHSVSAPSFVLDPAWPKPLPHNWIIGDVGGMYVDRHDHIWVYHRPRSLISTTDS